jgi:hypothetical protein
MNKLISILTLCIFSSCASPYVSEFHNIESLDKGKQRVAMSLGGGYEFEQEHYRFGLGAFHSIGVNNYMDWSTQTEVGTGSISIWDEYDPSRFSIVSGPKFTASESIALSIPIGISNYIDFSRALYGESRVRDKSLNFCLTPTIYLKVNPRLFETLFGYPLGGTNIFFLRTEYSTFDNIDGEYFNTDGLIDHLNFIYGYKYSGSSDGRNLSFSLSLGLNGLYGGFTFDLLKMANKPSMPIESVVKSRKINFNN